MDGADNYPSSFHQMRNMGSRAGKLNRLRPGTAWWIPLLWLAVAATAARANLISNLNSHATHAYLQDAVDAAQAGDTLFLFPGTYTEAAGIVVDRDLTITGAHASNTVVQAAPVAGQASNRVFRVDGANCVLEDLTIRHGGGTSYGGGVYANSTSTSTLNRCVLFANVARLGGGGAYGCTLNECVVDGNECESFGGGVERCTLYRCVLTDNQAQAYGAAFGSMLTACGLYENRATETGGGAGHSTLIHCTVTGNRASWHAGGAAFCGITNSIVHYNAAAMDSNLFGCSLAYSCSDVDPGGEGNLDVDPQLSSPLCLSPTSPCMAQGNIAYTFGTDLDGEAWAAPPSMGCDEPIRGALTGDLAATISVDYTQFATTYVPDVRAEIAGKATGILWDFGDGASASNRPFVSRRWPIPGTYEVVLSAWNETYPGGTSATVTVTVVSQPVHHVVAEEVGAIVPYATWATAASNIQDAVDAASVPGSLVLVSNGVYAVGGRAVDGGLTNRVAVTTPIEVRSVDGPEHTVILGAGPLGDTAVRCAYVGDHALITGFALSNGHTRATGDVAVAAGGGALCEPAGKLSGCVVTRNEARFGGGVANGLVERTMITENRAALHGGGTSDSVLLNCVLVGNRAESGGGASSATLFNCTVVSNEAPMGAGTRYCHAENSVIYYNQHWDREENHEGTTMRYSCTTPLPDPRYYGEPNLDAPPEFVGIRSGDFHLAPSSPCIDWGSNRFPVGPLDLDGFPRVVGPAVDLGAFEFLDGDEDGLPDYWEIRHHLDPEDDGRIHPENGAEGDPDLDRVVNLREFRDGTRPRDTYSAFIIRGLEKDAGNATCRITVGTEPGHAYRVEYMDGFPVVRPWQWGSFSNDRYGTWTETNAVSSEHTFVDDGTYLTTGRPPFFGRRHYRVLRLP